MNIFKVECKCGNSENIILENNSLTSNCFHDYVHNDQFVTCNCCKRLCVLGDQIKQPQLPSEKEIIRALVFQIEQYSSNESIEDFNGNFYTLSSIKHKYLNQ